MKLSNWETTWACDCPDFAIESKISIETFAKSISAFFFLVFKFLSDNNDYSMWDDKCINRCLHQQIKLEL